MRPWIVATFLGLLIALGGIAIVGVMSIILAVPTYFLWNWLMPEIFNIKEITFWQALGLNFLAGILFKSSGRSCKCKRESNHERQPY